MSLTFEDRLAAEVAPVVTCTACKATLDLTDEQWGKFKSWRGSLSQAALARVLDVGETSYKRHVRSGHADLR